MDETPTLEERVKGAIFASFFGGVTGSSCDPGSSKGLVIGSAVGLVVGGCFDLLVNFIIGRNEKRTRKAKNLIKDILIPHGYREMMESLKTVLKKEDYLGLVSAARRGEDYILETSSGKIRLYTGIPEYCCNLRISSITNFMEVLSLPFSHSNEDYERLHQNEYYQFGERLIDEWRASAFGGLGLSGFLSGKELRFERDYLLNSGGNYFIYKNWEKILAENAYIITTAERIMLDSINNQRIPHLSDRAIEEILAPPLECKLY